MHQIREVRWLDPHGECSRIGSLCDDCTTAWTYVSGASVDCEANLITQPHFGCNLWEPKQGGK